MNLEQERKNKQQTEKLFFGTPQEVAPFVYKLYQQHVPPKKVEKMLKNSEYGFDTYALDMELINKKIINDIYNGDAYRGESKEIFFSPQEVAFIADYCDFKLDPEVAKKAKGKENIRNLLCAYLAISRYDDYESGWINYHTKRIFALSGMGKLPEKVKNEVVNALVKEGLVQLKVVGKKNPILCYKLEWREAEAEEDSYTFTLTPDMGTKTFVAEMDKIFKNLLTD